MTPTRPAQVRARPVQPRLRRCPALFVALALVAVAAPTAPAAPAQREAPAAAARFAIEEHYRAPGPWTVTSTDVAAPDRELTYRIVRPRDLGAGGFRHPILLWGNGTNSTPKRYTGVLNQLASWGFVVIASTDGAQANGRSMLAGLRYLLGAVLDPTSACFGVLDLDNIGALGHSQGAGGAINATNHSGGLVDTVVPINLPDYRYVGAGGEFSASDLAATALFLGGSADGLIAPPSTLRRYYDQVPRAAIGVLRHADHLTIQRTGGGYLGYLTAWMMWQLQHDPYAAGAFVGPDPEGARNTRWQGHRAKGLPHPGP